MGRERDAQLILAGWLVVEGCIVGPFAAAQVLDGNGGNRLLDQFRMFVDNAADRGYPGAGEMAGSERENEGSAALVLGDLREIFGERENAEPSVFLNRVGAVGVS